MCTAPFSSSCPRPWAPHRSRGEKDAYWAEQVEIQRLAGAAWLARAEGKDEEARGLLRSAADLVDRSDKHPVTPGSVLPAREMLGDLLLEQGQARAFLAKAG